MAFFDDMTEQEIRQNKAIRGYIEFTDKRATAYNAYRRDAVIQLTKAGVDLVEGTREDPGVDV